MPVHKTTNSRGIERLVHTGQMRHWRCAKCDGSCGYTWAQERVIRYAFCQSCDEVNQRVATRDKSKK